MEKSDQINELAAALAKAQGAMGAGKMDSITPHFKSKYANLTSVWEACRKALTENGLSIAQTTGQTETNDFIVTTLLLHSSGQWIASNLTLRPQRNDPQGIGSALSYGRRYGLAAMIGVVSDEDDDGNHASSPVPENKPLPSVSQRPAPNVSNINQNVRPPKIPVRQIKGEKIAKDVLENDFKLEKTHNVRFGDHYELEYAEDDDSLSVVKIWQENKTLKCNCDDFQASAKFTNAEIECEHIIAYKIVQKTRKKLQETQTA